MLKDIFCYPSPRRDRADWEVQKRTASIGVTSGHVLSGTHPQTQFLTFESEVRAKSVAATPFQSSETPETCGTTLTGGTEGVFATETGSVRFCRLQRS
ncbi:MAG: hypothetical protein RIE73_01025 [Coleofasciculus sp. C1-SOL-03]|uniref:hypothetical protein n=1 Tax=Coleofasciculus sp. C1-SOL-03 TaxID=3069522 RepID=UPI0033026B5A